MSDCTKEDPCNFPGCEVCGPKLTSVGRDELLAIIRGLLVNAQLMKARLEEPKLPMRRAAVVALQNIHGDYLVVWNRRFGGWTLPGGKLEPGETPIQAAARELEEETGLPAQPVNEAWFEQVYEAVNKTQAEDMLVTVFRVRALEGYQGSDADRAERGCPIGWLSAEDLLRWSPFADFYRRGRVLEPSTLAANASLGAEGDVSAPKP
jgi:8-oxo-dGTP pyrophosphatase MutT (NUDIX family)